jgi:hypothetical protein
VRRLEGVDSNLVVTGSDHKAETDERAVYLEGLVVLYRRNESGFVHPSGAGRKILFPVLHTGDSSQVLFLTGWSAPRPNGTENTGSHLWVVLLVRLELRPPEPR